MFHSQVEAQRFNFLILINQWKLVICMKYTSCKVYFNYTFQMSCFSCEASDCVWATEKERYPTCLPSQGSYWLYVCPIHSRYQTGNLWKILLVWDWIPYGGWMLVYGRISMKTELVEGVVCGVLLMNCFSRDRYHLICITQEIRYHKTGQSINQ